MLVQIIHDNLVVPWARGSMTDNQRSIGYRSITDNRQPSDDCQLLHQRSIGYCNYSLITDLELLWIVNRFLITDHELRVPPIEEEQCSSRQCGMMKEECES